MRKFGLFKVKEEMIFIDREGKIRVWMNLNFFSYFFVGEVEIVVFEEQVEYFFVVYVECVQDNCDWQLVVVVDVCDDVVFGIEFYVELWKALCGGFFLWYDFGVCFGQQCVGFVDFVEECG